MQRSIRRGTLALGVALLALTGAACGSGDDSSDSASDNAAESTPAPTRESSSDSGMAEPAADLVGPGCADYAEQVPDGAGSVAGMAQDPVAVAASNNPLLGTLVQAVSGQLNPEVNLVDTLNGDEFTVFAPVDDAFAQIPAATIDTLRADDAMLTEILTYHVVPGQLAPDQVVGEQSTVQGGTVSVTGSGDSLKANDANVICGGVRTANATVYLIDGVLMPPA